MITGLFFRKAFLSNAIVLQVEEDGALKRDATETDLLVIKGIVNNPSNKLTFVYTSRRE